MFDIFPPPESLDLTSTAFFLDLDGTLAEIVPDPRQTRVEPEVIAALGALSDASGGALAVVSGRSISQLDTLLAPLVLPVAGVHGLERRTARGETMRTPFDAAIHHDVVERMLAFVAGRHGLMVEAKPGSVALHYRNAPELAGECLGFARTLSASHESVRLVAGKLVVEAKLADKSKGDAIGAFMTEPPFAGRTPFFAGDDVTDEAGFAVVARARGMTLKVGPGQSLARYRLADPEAVARYLAALAGR